MAKQLNVSLGFTANTSQAKNAIMELQNALSKVASMKIDSPGVDADKIKAASSAAKELSIHLNNAFNAQTGNFDLSKLDRSLKTSSTNVTELSSKLLGAGASGEQAFVKLAQSIAAADRPVVTLNSKLNEMLTTLKNTARWQISSSILHGFMGAVQQAYGYAQDLNESLTNIRIVTGQNMEQMSQFAVEANKAAKALSTTTTEYTNASLIYYQQGLSDAEVAKRTEVTIKMANAAGQSAQIVSDQLTAIWNNFYDGSKSLEYYADVMTALGAATASSTDEIAGGLEKFAAIGETIGLSYEYAASALATITSNTRQSEEVVGTALKTIFARIQGLNLGETLDDGTTLNKYSKALQSVGISIFDQAGELKNMDNILNEMADKWDTLSKAQQVALAQTVAGTRQYTQLVALMDNWDNGDNDSMTANLDTAYNATGALQEQADIYAESWEAARDRVTASMEAIYSDIIDDKFFIDISNGFSSLIDSVDAFIDGVGGIKTIVMGIGSFFLASIANKIQPALQNLKHTFSVVFQSAEQQAKQLATEMNASIVATLNSKQGKDLADSSKTALNNAMQLNNAKAKMQAVENALTEAEKQRYTQELSMIQMQQQETQEVADRITKLKQEKEAILDIAAVTSLTASGQKTYTQGSREMESYVSDARQDVQAAETIESVTAATQALTEARQAASQYQAVQEDIISSISDIDNAFRNMGSSLDLTNPKEHLQELNNIIQTSFTGNLQTIKTNLKEVGDSKAGFESIRNQIDLLVSSMPKAISQSEEMQDALTDVFTAKTSKQMEKAIQKIEIVLKKSKIEAKDFAKVLKEINPKRYQELETNANKTNKALEELEKKQQAVNRAINAFKPEHTVSGIESITKLASGLGQVAMAAQSVRSIFQAWANDDLSFGEKLMTSLTSIGMIIPSVMSGIKNLNSALNISVIAQQAMALAASQYAANNTEVVASMTAETLAAKLKISTDAAQLAIMQAKAAMVQKDIDNGKLKIAALTAEVLAEKLGITTDQAALVMSALKEKGTLAEALAEVGLTTAKGAGTVATIAQTVANWALQASMSPILLITLLLVGAFILLAGVALGVVAVFNAIKNSTPEAQLESARAATEAAKTAAEGAKTAYEDLLSTIEKYDNAVGALENLSKGTQEYTDKLLEANEAARELIDTYGLTKFSVEDGLIKLDKNELDTKKAEYNDRVEDTSSALTGAQKFENSKEDQLTKRNLYTDVMSKSTHYATTSDGYSYKDNYLINQDNMSKVMEAANSAEGGWDAYFADGGKNIAETMGWDFENLDSYQQDFINALTNSSSALEEANAAILANAAANEAATKAQLVQNLSDEEEFQDSKYQDELLGAALNTQEQTEASAAETLAGMTQDQMYDAYAEMMGYTNNGIGTWLDGKQEFLDKDGNKIELTPEQVKAQMTEMYSQQGMEENALNLVDTMNKVMARADENKGVISTAITGDTDKLTIGQQNMAASDVAAMVTDEEAIAMGFESAAAFGESFAAATENFAGEWQNAMSGYVESVQDQMQSMYDSGKLNDLTLAQSQSLASAYETAYATSGQAGMDALTSMFDKTGEYSDEFATALGTIDWSTATPETLQAALEDAGVATKFTSGELENLIDVMYDGAIGVDAAAEKYKNLSEVLSSLKSGDTISAEEFESLGPGMEDYFMRMADGTYKLIGDAEAFYAAVSAESLEGFEDTIREKTADNEQIENVLNHDIASLGTVGGQNPYAMGGHSYQGNGQYAMNSDAANAQLDFLEQTGYDSAQIQQWRDDMAAGTLDVVALTKAVNDQTVALGGAAAAEEYLTQQMDANNTEIAQSKEAIASTATSLDELDQMLQDGKISMEAYDKASQGVFEKEVEAEGFDTEELNNYVDALIKSGKFLEENREEAQKFALAQYRMEKGCTELVEGYEDWDKILSDNEASLKDINKIMPKVNSMLQDMMDLSDEEFALLPDNFAKDNWNLIQDVYNEVDGAYEALRAKITEEIIMNIGLDQSQLTAVQGAVDTFLANVNLDDITVGTTLDQTGFSAGLQALLDSGAVTVDQMNDILSGIGYEPNIEYEEVTLSEAQAAGQTGYVQVAGVNGTIETVPVTAEMNLSSDAKVLIPKIGSSKFKGGGGGVADAKANTGGGGGGGGSKPKKADTVKKTDVVERYKEVNDDLDDLKEKLDDASKAADRLYGADRIKQMQAQNGIIKDEINLLKQKKVEAEKYLAIDKKALQDVGKENGLNFTFDKNGNINNYDQQMSKLYDELDAAIKKANADGNADEDEQEVIDKIQERIDAVTDAISQYDETRELNEDLDNELDDKYYQWQDNNAEILNYQLELKLEINDMELEKVEYYLGKMEDDFYQMAEAGALMLGSLNPDTLGEGGQLGVYLHQLEDYETQLKDLEAAYANGEISQAAYIESLKEVKSGIYESLESLQELDKTMMEYYGDTIAMAQDELAKYTDQMEHHSSVLEHYSTILELTGKSNDYEALGAVLEGQAKTAENQVKVAKETMDMYKNQANDRFAEYQKALAAGDEAAAELYLKQYEEALNAANEAEEEYLSSAEEWAESLRAVLENTMSKLAQSLENTLTGGTSFDQMTTAMERAASLQEEYLTTTNQIYETNKLMRTAQQEIDKTTNSVAKNKLRGFIEETQQLQNQSELSQYELEIQQAKYDLLLAEIALEEAQDAKSMVRLQRDAEGNFGYVYTADSSAVSEAEQQLADAQNNLYNIGLEGANGYTEKYQQTMSEMYDTLQDLQQQKLDGMFETEQEYQDAVTAAKEYYYDKLKQYSNLYSVALTTDNRVVVDAWSSDFAEMTARTDDWMVAVNEYIGGVQDALTLYEEQMNTIAVETVGGDLDTIRDKTKDITDANDDLVDKITNPEDGVIKAITDEMDAVANLTGKYANLRTTIQGLMGDYEDLTETIDETVEDTTENGDNNTGKPPEDPEPPAPTEPEPPAEDPTTAETGPTYQKGTLTWSGNGGNRVWKDSAGNKYTYGSPEQKAIQKAFDRAYSANGGYHGDYWIDWGKLNADVLHKKYGLATGGYTGDWAGSYGKLAFLHQKELVLNRGDTENFLASMEVMERILQMIDLQSASSQLGGILSSPTLGSTGTQTIEQQINIEAHFPDATDRFEIEEAFMSMANLASQYANRK